MFSKPFFLFSIITLSLYTIVLFFYYDATQVSAINQAKQKTKDFLRKHDATENFLKKDLKNRIDRLKREGKVDKNLFLSSLYTCTYASKRINHYYNLLREEESLPKVDFSYITKNPRIAKNMADDQELELLEKFNTEELNEFSKVMEVDGKKYLYYAKPIKRTSYECLRCHGNPSGAPKKILEKYGNVKGFHYEIGDINAFKKVVMPLDSILDNSLRLFLVISVSLLFILIGIYIAIRVYIVRTISEKKKFQNLIDSLDEIIIVKKGEELASVNKSFLHFFHVKDTKEFISTYGCISNLFDKNPNSLEIDFHDSKEELIEKINTTEPSKRIIHITGSDKKRHSFRIRVDTLGEQSDTFVIVLSDITLLQGQADALAHRANIDALTQVCSRQRFDDLYYGEFWRSLRYFNDLTILFIDIDFFKSINDTYGHDIGDKTLQEFAKVLQENIRKFDILARWGGEEFILMLPQTHINDGYKLAEKLRLLIKNHKFEKIESLTCSIGISMLKKADETTTLIKRADIALYKAKNSGRDKIIMEI